MKKLFFLLILGLLYGCEEVIDLEVPSAPQKLVIDALITKSVFETQKASVEVKLMNTSDYFDTSIPAVSGADVKITNVSTNEIWSISESDDKGTYSMENVVLDTLSPYQLTITIEGEIYEATSQLVRSVPIKSVVQGDQTLFTGDETEIILSYQDVKDREDYYFIDFGYNNYFVGTDKFYDGSDFSFSFFYDEDFPKNEEVFISMLGIDEAAYNYFRILLSQSGQGGGGPFSTPSSTLRGNIQNSTNPENFPLGYFRISEKDQVPFTAE
jgi:hypothetical protein